MFVFVSYQATAVNNEKCRPYSYNSTFGSTLQNIFSTNNYKRFGNQHDLIRMKRFVIGKHHAFAANIGPKYQGYPKDVLHFYQKNTAAKLDKRHNDVCELLLTLVAISYNKTIL